ncbi:MAG TPA: tRNA (adenosine(37)-N6)-threonylcarbamoyltransferase complex dimerization subunit type 1 TsaB [Bacteroidales bacterium]|mgnify:FL=1|nr:tRNA (adenosine(37)-N6)-threonylcarbamoyltransferase complex dimerization subunit type 1 TsaB [Bacteroidales bacterium]
MTLILNIETSGEVCSVAISENEKLIAVDQTNEKNSHSTKLAPLTNDIFKKSGIKPAQINAIAISRGPGSYTGLRIGASFAKGLCYSLNIPLIAVDTLMIMCVRVLQMRVFNSQTLLCPMIDARRMEVYTAMYDLSLIRKTEISPLILNENAFEQYENNDIVFFGTGMNKWQEYISKNIMPNFTFIPDIYPTAESMAELSYSLFNEKKFENTAYFEPFYLKEFIAGIPTKNKLF